MRRLARVAVLATAVCGFAAAADAANTWVLHGARIYPSPDAAPIENGSVVWSDGKIVAVGKHDEVTVPPDARTSNCDGGYVMAGFQNSHVHFLEPQWNDAAKAPAPNLSHYMEQRFTRYGFTTVVDVASDRDNTLALRGRVESGEVRGPRILTVGLPLFPVDGIPFYLNDQPPELFARMPQPKNASEAIAAVRENLSRGADGTKLFLVTSPGNQVIKRLSMEVALAAGRETHAHHKLLMAHPSTLEGIRAAIDAGVDILTHTTLGETRPWDDAIIQQMIDRGMSVTPTLKLWYYELAKEDTPKELADKLVQATLEELRAFSRAGGQVLFGTDAGYMLDHDPTEEYVLMSRAGLKPMQILASLTTAPAARWEESARRGRLAKGQDADIVVLSEDPELDPRNFAAVRCVFRNGAMLYPAPGRR